MMKQMLSIDINDIPMADRCRAFVPSFTETVLLHIVLLHVKTQVLHTFALQLIAQAEY